MSLLKVLIVVTPRLTVFFCISRTLRYIRSLVCRSWWWWWPGPTTTKNSMSVAPASQAHTYLLDLEQLVVVAGSLENTKTASYTTPAAPASTTTNANTNDDCDSCTGWSTNPFSDQEVLEGTRRSTDGGGGVEVIDKYSPFRRMFPRQEEEWERRKWRKISIY